MNERVRWAVAGPASTVFVALITGLRDRGWTTSETSSNRARPRPPMFITVLRIIALVAVAGGVVLIDGWLRRPL